MFLFVITIILTSYQKHKKDILMDTTVLGVSNEHTSDTVHFIDFSLVSAASQPLLYLITMLIYIISKFNSFYRIACIKNLTLWSFRDDLFDVFFFIRAKHAAYCSVFCPVRLKKRKKKKRSTLCDVENFQSFRRCSSLNTTEFTIT